MSDPRPNEKPNNKRKKKKSVLINARKYAKKGTFGRGTHMEEDTYRYFVSVLELLRDGFENDEAKQSLVNNVFEQVIGKEVDYSCNQIGCRVIEALLPMSNPDVLENFCKALSDDLRPMCSDRFASHVIEKLVDVCAKRSTDNLQDNEAAKTKILSQKSYATEHLDNCNKFTIKISKYLLNNLEDFVWDNYANHIIRTCITNVAGLEKLENEKKNFQGINQSFRIIPEEWTDIAVEYSERLFSWPQFGDLPFSDITSGMLQTNLSSLSKCNNKLQQKMIKKLVKESFAPKSNMDDVQEVSDLKIPPVFESQSAMRLLEVAILLANEKMLEYIYKKCFMNNLRALSLMKICNFSVQKLIDCCKSKEQFEIIINELTPSFGDILSSGHTGVLVALAKTCTRLASQQGLYVKTISNALHCEDSNHSFKLASLTARLLPLERADKAETFFVNVHGSVILQEMLHFNKPIKIVNSLMSMGPNDLLALFCDPKGSHIADAFFQSKFIGEKSREKMCRCLKGTFQQLAVSKSGSRVLECIWEKSDQSQRIRMMNELVSKVGLLTGSDIGRIICNKYNVELYKRSPEDWEQFTQKTTKIKNLFDDILEDNEKK